MRREIFQIIGAPPEKFHPRCSQAIAGSETNVLALALIRKVADRIVVIEHGKIVESGPSHQIISAPRHPHTRALIEASPILLAETM